MTTFTETQGRPMFITRMRRLSKSNFTVESNRKSPRLDKMIAHVSLFDRTTKCLEAEIVQAQQDTPTQKRSGGRPRPGMGSRATEYVKSDEDVPSWIADLTSRPPQQDCIVVTETEHAEDIDDESP